MTLKENNKLSPNMEDYLETISFLREKNKVVRVRDISSVLNVKAPSVTSALAILSKNDLVIHERYGYVHLTKEGEKLAKVIAKKHKILIKFLTQILDIDSEIAKDDACKMEHSISSQTFERLTKFMKFIEESPVSGKPKWLKGFSYYLKTGKRRKCQIERQKTKKKE